MTCGLLRLAGLLTALSSVAFPRSGECSASGGSLILSPGLVLEDIPKCRAEGTEDHFVGINMFVIHSGQGNINKVLSSGHPTAPL